MSPLGAPLTDMSTCVQPGVRLGVTALAPVTESLLVPCIAPSQSGTGGCAGSTPRLLCVSYALGAHDVSDMDIAHVTQVALISVAITDLGIGSISAAVMQFPGAPGGTAIARARGYERVMSVGPGGAASTVSSTRSATAFMRSS